MREPFQTIFIAGLNSQKLMSPVNFIIPTSPSVSPGLRRPAGAHRIMLLEDIFTLDIFSAQVLHVPCLFHCNIQWWFSFNKTWAPVKRLFYLAGSICVQFPENMLKIHQQIANAMAP